MRLGLHSKLQHTGSYAELVLTSTLRTPRNILSGRRPANLANWQSFPRAVAPNLCMYYIFITSFAVPCGCRCFVLPITTYLSLGSNVRYVLTPFTALSIGAWCCLFHWTGVPVRSPHCIIYSPHRTIHSLCGATRSLYWRFTSPLHYNLLIAALHCLFVAIILSIRPHHNVRFLHYAIIALGCLHIVCKAFVFFCVVRSITSAWGGFTLASSSVMPHGDEEVQVSRKGARTQLVRGSS